MRSIARRFASSWAKSACAPRTCSSRFCLTSRAVIGLGVLRSRRAEPQLVELFEAERQAQLDAKGNSGSAWYAHGLMDLARALWLIDPDPRWPVAAIDALADGREWTERMEAAMALYDVRDPVVVPPLIGALDDADALVRYHAARGLLAVHGLPVDTKDLDHMVYRVMSDAAARRESGKEDILAAIAGRPISLV